MVWLIIRRFLSDEICYKKKAYPYFWISLLMIKDQIIKKEFKNLS